MSTSFLQTRRQLAQVVHSQVIGAEEVGSGLHVPKQASRAVAAHHVHRANGRAGGALVAPAEGLAPRLAGDLLDQFRRIVPDHALLEHAVPGTGDVHAINDGGFFFQNADNFV